MVATLATPLAKVNPHCQVSIVLIFKEILGVTRGKKVVLEQLLYFYDLRMVVTISQSTILGLYLGFIRAIKLV